MINNIGFIGSGGDFSLQPLKFLLSSKHKLCLVGVDGLNKTLNGDPRLQIFQPNQIESVESIARQHKIPIVDFQQNLTHLINQLDDYQLDLLVVACYNKKLSEAILKLPKIACINLHPSLLPAYRGPVPLFWQFREGLKEYGISLHRMEKHFDTGPIIRQQAVSFNDGITQQQANAILAEVGTQLLADYLINLETNHVTEQRQFEKLSSYMSYPIDKDFMVSNTWSAQRLYNFIAATKHWGKVYPCKIGEQIFELVDVISYDAVITNKSISPHQSYQVKNDIISIRCQPGMLKARLFNPINGRILA